MNNDTKQGQPKLLTTEQLAELEQAEPRGVIVPTWLRRFAGAFAPESVHQR